LDLRVALTQGPGEAGWRVTTRDLKITIPPAVISGGGMMPLDNTAVIDAVLIGWPRPGAPTARRSPAQGGATAGPSVSGRTWLISGRPRTPVLDAGSIDALLGDPGMPHSLLDLDGNGRPITRKL